MYVCYIDESGTSNIPGNTSHFVLAGISIPIAFWRDADAGISTILLKYGLQDREFHTAWLLRPYLEQTKIPNFERLDWPSRRSAVERVRAAHLLQLQRSGNRASYQQVKKNYKQTEHYTHLTRDERGSLIREVADCVSDWTSARLFAECVDKLHFDPVKTNRNVDEQAFEQVVSRFEQYLRTGGAGQPGLLVHDNNETIARKHTELMRHFHRQGTLWTQIQHIIETPLFVDSSLTRMVQVADLCSYALRRYVENAESDLFRRVFARGDRAWGGVVVGVRHFSKLTCDCEICKAHKPLS